MARLPRVTSKVFAENATEVGQFGSLNAGTKVTTTDIATIQGLPAWEDGWKAANLGDNCYPTLQERNGLDKVQSYMINYLYQEGIPEWDMRTTYYTGSIVKLINGTDVQFYKSLIDNNTNALSDTASWEEILVSGANKDLSNLTTTGVNNLIQYAHELDWDNVITVSTTNSQSIQTYIIPSAGLFRCYMRSQTSAGNVKQNICQILDENNNPISGGGFNFPSNVAVTTLLQSASKICIKNETVRFLMYGNGMVTNSGEAIFVPFKAL